MADKDIEGGAVLGSTVGPGALAALDDDGIIVDLHVAAMYQHVVADIEVDGIARRRTMFLGVARRNDTFGWRIDEIVEVAHVLATIEMVGPEG